MPRVTVANRKYVKVGEYVGRPTPLGNRFKVHHEWQRDEACDNYEQWLGRMLESKEPAVCKEMNRLYAKAKRGRVILLCSCTPLRCHAEHIARVLNKTLGERMEQGLVLTDEELEEIREQAYIAACEDVGPNSEDFSYVEERIYDRLCSEAEARKRKLKSVSNGGAT